MSAPAVSIGSDSGELSQNDAIERLISSQNAGRIPDPKPITDLMEGRDDEDGDGNVEIEAQGEADDVEVEADALDDEEAPNHTADPVVKFDDGTELALSEVKRGYLRQQDYTRKTQEAAELRKTVESERASYLNEKRQVSERLEPLIQQAIAMLQDPGAQRELAELRVTDPGAYAVRVMEQQQKAAQIQMLQAEQARLRESAEREESERFQRERSETAKRSRETLMETIPAAKKDFATWYQGVGKYVLEQGIPAEAWDNEVDHRVITLAWKAMQYDRATSKTRATSDQLGKAPRPMRPGAAKPPGYAQSKELREATERAAKSGSFDDAVALMTLKLKSSR